MYRLLPRMHFEVSMSILCAADAELSLSLRKIWGDL